MEGFAWSFGVSMLTEVVNLVHAYSADHQPISPLFLKSIESIVYKTVHRGGVQQGPF